MFCPKSLPKRLKHAKVRFAARTIIFCLVAALGLVLVQLRWCLSSSRWCLFQLVAVLGLVLCPTLKFGQTNRKWNHFHPVGNAGSVQDYQSCTAGARRSPRASTCIPARPSSCRDGGLEIAERTLRHMEQTEMSGKTRGSDAGSMRSVRSSMPADEHPPACDLVEFSAHAQSEAATTIGIRSAYFVSTAPPRACRFRRAFLVRALAAASRLAFGDLEELLYLRVHWSSFRPSALVSTSSSGSASLMLSASGGRLGRLGSRAPIALFSRSSRMRSRESIIS